MSKENSMHRTQVYLTEEEHKALKAFARRDGRSFAATLREAVDTYIHGQTTGDLRQAIDQSFGCWRDGDAAETDVRTLRQEWERREERQE
ncbi:MAG: CopG family transcriptional regulator [Gammaproteobacteria bacterium]